MALSMAPIRSTGEIHRNAEGHGKPTVKCPPRIVIADDDALSRRLTQRALERAGYEVTALENGSLAAKCLSTPGGPRLALLDWEMPGLDGPGVCRAIRAIHDQPYIYIILLTSKESKADLVAGLEAGADDYLTKPCHAEELNARLRTGQRILDLQDRMFYDARHDFLTKLPNRVHFFDRLAQCVVRSAKDRNYRFAVLFADLDRFKTVNDSLGHSAGDELLTQVAERLLGSIRRKDPVLPASDFNTISRVQDDDILARIGGDEFTVLLDDIRCTEDATRIAARIRNELTAPFWIAGHEIEISASIGISIGGGREITVEEILHDADASMYRAKASGKTVVLSAQLNDQSGH
jgi:PleD family two-component response regulator